ncbi:HPP family protein [Nocardiopsis tropica]|uniref:HPP family protein n=1 Tax=Nocardiopsis tropica TaxID=109330 RepID=A0ABU7L1Q7_9ACTN|nr:HPP family protein [Nocardiopsis umidischolae]MEE2055486.1 HPP family protein [Nocardiopsis umidischolae]
MPPTRDDAPGTGGPAPCGPPAGPFRADRLGLLLAGRAPAPAGFRAVAAGTATSVAALLLLAAGTVALDVPLLIPPLAASMALVAGAPTLPLAQPRSVVGGQLLSAMTGFLVLLVVDPGLWGGALAGGLALGVMALTRTPHSPAAATAVIVALEAPPFWPFLGLLLAAAAVLVAVGLLGARASGRPYPAYWW